MILVQSTFLGYHSTSSVNLGLSSYREVLTCGAVCRSWYKVCADQLLWQKLMKKNSSTKMLSIAPPTDSVEWTSEGAASYPSDIRGRYLFSVGKSILGVQLALTHCRKAKARRMVYS